MANGKKKNVCIVYFKNNQIYQQNDKEKVWLHVAISLRNDWNYFHLASLLKILI